jgi:hypothetical protein
MGIWLGKSETCGSDISAGYCTERIALNTERFRHKSGQCGVFKRNCEREGRADVTVEDAKALTQCQSQHERNDWTGIIAAATMVFKLQLVRESESEIMKCSEYTRTHLQVQVTCNAIRALLFPFSLSVVFPSLFLKSTWNLSKISGCSNGFCNAASSVLCH